jgi:membrane protein implicated in regulation of membrane protease activity
MDFFSSEYAALIWLAIGAALIITEFFITPGVGVVFIGLGALTTGALLQLQLIGSTETQLISLSVASVFWALLLWKPLKRLVKTQNRNHNQSHIIGTEAIVSGKGVNKTSGTAKWSGTEMNARLAADAEVAELTAGDLAEVVELDGSVLILKPKQ